ncbi:MAG: hypothetical protein IH920_03140, partial [Chloroflexi bacterium]|nr:hypothetical protein [Chloroflexota bacterium]
MPKASASLQERLRLSARMLKAFQSQIDTAQNSLSTLGASRDEAAKTTSKLNAQVSEVETTLQEASKSFEQDVEAAFEKRLKRFEDQLTRREAAVESMVNQVADSRQRMESLLGESQERIAKLVTDTQEKVSQI